MDKIKQALWILLDQFYRRHRYEYDLHAEKCYFEGYDEVLAFHITTFPNDIDGIIKISIYICPGVFIDTMVEFKTKLASISSQILEIDQVKEFLKAAKEQIEFYVKKYEKTN